MFPFCNVSQLVGGGAVTMCGVEYPSLDLGYLLQNAAGLSCVWFYQASYSHILLISRASKETFTTFAVLHVP